MRARILLGILLCQIGIGGLTTKCDASGYIYRGTWTTVNRPLDGEMTCVVTPTAKHAWQGRFFGVWQGVEFDYTVDFTGPPKALQGSAMIDGASYEWRAWITREAMKANFSGSRYEGSFDLKRVSDADIARDVGRPNTSADSR
jgi:hypothetical protein